MYFGTFSERKYLAFLAVVSRYVSSWFIESGSSKCMICPSLRIVNCVSVISIEIT